MNKTDMNPRTEAAGEPVPETWHLRLYVAGQTPKSLEAFTNLKRICETHLKGRFSIEVIDLVEHPEMAREHQIVALPTLVRQLPPPIRKIIGTLANEERVLLGLDIQTAPSEEAG